MAVVAVHGCGRVGQCYVAVLAMRGHSVNCYDVNPNAYRQMFKSSEPQVAQVLAENADAVNVGKYYNEEVHFIVVNTPSMEYGAFDASCVRSAIQNIPVHAPVVVVSTVSPGTCDTLLNPRRIVYAPALIRLGSVIDDMLSATLSIVGYNSSAAIERVVRLLDQISPASRLTLGLNLEEAELVKIAVNGYLTTKISFANAIALHCHYKGLSASRVLESIGLDPRIGQSYFRPGGSFGGPCFPRDTKALGQAVTGLSDHMYTNDTINNMVVEYTVSEALRLAELSSAKSIAVLGMAYSETSNISTESYGSRVFDRLKQVKPDSIMLFNETDGSAAFTADILVAGLASYGRDYHCHVNLWS